VGVLASTDFLEEGFGFGVSLGALRVPSDSRSIDRMRPAVTPRDASTILLLRPADPFEVFLVRRHQKSQFMGGMYVFPGGKLDEQDLDPELESLCYGLSAAEAAEILGDELPPSRALGLFVAAVRETFEEANILLAVNGQGQPIDPEVATLRLAQERARLQNGETSLTVVLRSLGWQVDLSRIRYLAHWVTPPVEPRRFSARFFVVETPSQQRAVHDARETTDGQWLSPALALEHLADPRHQIQMAPPTIRILERMGRCKTLSEALQISPHAPVHTQAPRLVLNDGVACLVLDGDPLHPDKPGAVRDRFEMRDARWVSIQDNVVS
jgi:8-oxo-dGTP pyrophosphatase MutT (NUDIX family)